MGQIVPQTGATFRVNAGSVAPGQTLKTFTGRQLLSASIPTTTSLYTVTSGKTFYVTDINLSTITTNEVDCQIQGGGATVFRVSILNTSPCEATGIETQPFVPAGQLVTLLFPAVTGAPNVSYFVSGFEQ